MVVVVPSGVVVTLVAPGVVVTELPVLAGKTSMSAQLLYQKSVKFQYQSRVCKPDFVLAGT